MISINNRDPRPIYLQIKEGLCRLILTGVLSEGEKMPSVRELAGQLAINPNTIQRAYRLLEFNGWIVTIPGKGCFVCDNEQQVEQEVHRWYTAFDEATASLIALGVSREQMIERIKRGGRKDA